MPKSRSIDITEGFLKTEDIANTYENLSLLTVKGNLTIEGGLTFPDNTLQTTAYTGAGITVQDEGSILSTSATTLNFVGSGVVASGTESTKTITVSDTNTTYAVSAVDSGDNAIIRLTGSDASTDDVTLVAGADITITPAGDNITISSTAQPTLVSGTNIKTVNSTTLLGSGNLDVQPTLVSGTNIKTVNSTTLLGSGNLDVQPTLVSGTNIKTVNGTTLLGSGNITISGGGGGGGGGEVGFEQNFLLMGA